MGPYYAKRSTTFKVLPSVVGLGNCWVCILTKQLLVFAPALKSLDLYFSFGPWKWGLDSSSAVYLISLAVAIYILFRLKNPKLSIGRTGIFLELVENLHLTKRYDDLAQLLAPQLEKLISIIDRPVKNRLCDKIANNLRSLIARQLLNMHMKHC